LPTEEATWKQIDHELVTLKLHDVAMNLHRETEKKRNDIRRRNLTNENAATIPLELFELELRQMKQWVFNLYSLYKEVWKIQGKEETPQFIRAVYRKAILPLIKSRTACSRDFLTRRATRTSLSRSVLAPQLLELGREAERLRSEWRRKTETVAIELEHSRKVRSKHRRSILEKKKAGRRALPPTPSEARARTVAKIIKELDILKPQMFGESDYERLARENSGFFTFKVSHKRPDLSIKVVSVQLHQRHIRLAQELAAAHHGRALSTIQTDWKKHKPKHYRRNQG
jgi:hypothetical protein